MTRSTVFLHPGKDKPIRQRHPWIFSGAIERVSGHPAPGDLVDVADARGEWLATGYFNPKSQIVVRLLTWQRGEDVAATFWRKRLAAAAAARAGQDGVRCIAQTTAYRLAYAESDGLPGLIVDRYGDWLVVQFLTLGVETRRKMLLELLVELFAPRGIVDRSDASVRRQEGLPLRSELAWGEPPAGLELMENGLRFGVDLLGGQKTGFYLDQRENRRIVGGHAAGRRVLNAFSFTGAFGVYALAGGATHVTNVDSSVEALQGAEATLRLNGFDPDRQAEGIAGDVFQVLRAFRDEGRQFDLVILDPPKFARSKAELDGATRGYKDINLLGLKLLAPGGLLATFSCSGLVTPDLFQKIIFGASVDAGRNAQIIARLGQGADHPILLSFPEGEYLKGLLCRVVGE
ncbi:MAG: class I SAM-dependent rRNA methyltransferase [Chloroflexi bacterium]|nr:class I SAM-dependent rRNA methyltransferase [Chloroflexota bacterium]